MDKSISDHIEYKEAVKSITARRQNIDNTPSRDEVDNMRLLAKTLFEPMREALGGKPIGIASFYRSQELNKAIGGSDNSQHCEGLAIDIDGDIVGLHTNREIFEYLHNNLIQDQLIGEFPDENGEFEWVHVSKKPRGNREETLIAFKENGQTKYKYYE